MFNWFLDDTEQNLELFKYVDYVYKSYEEHTINF